MGKLILIRHGQTDGLDNHSEINPDVPISRQEGIDDLFWRSLENLLVTPLNEWGIRQAEITAVHLQQFPIEELRSSTALRAVHTADIISNKLGLPFSSAHSEDSITERMNFGDSLDQTWNGFLKEWVRLDEDSNNEPLFPYLGDSTQQSGEKMNQFLLTLPDHEEDIVVVSHGGKIRDFANQLIIAGNVEQGISLRRPDERGRETKGLANCSITIVRKQEGNFILESLGTTAHLERIVENGLPRRHVGRSKER